MRKDYMSKKSKGIIIFLVMVMMLSFNIHANAKSTNIIIGDKFTEVKTTPIIINDKMVYTSFPSFIYNNSTYVPVRFISDIFGAKVSWNDEFSSLLIEKNGETLILFPNQNFASINDKITFLDDSSMPIIACLPNSQYGHTMVPLDLIANFLNCNVGYDASKEIPYISSKSISNNSAIKISNQNANEIKNVEIINDYLLIQGANNVDYNIVTLDNPSRIVIDIKDSVLKGGNCFSLNGDKLNVKTIRGSQFICNKTNGNKNVVRIVLDLKNNSDLFYLDIVPSGQDLKIYTKFK